MLQKYSARSARRFLLEATILAAALFSATAALPSCSRKAPARASSAKSASPAPLAAKPGPGPEAPAPAAPKPAAPLAASLRAFGLGAASVPRLPSDFSLGPLQSYYPAPGDESAVFAVATSFLEGLAAGKLEAGLLMPAARDALSVLLAPGAGRQPPPGSGPGYRMGKIAIAGGDASLEVRLPPAGAAGDGQSKAAREEGLLTLGKIGDAWYVEALALAAPAYGALAFDPGAGTRAR
jgi:hypothetical protein